MKSVKITFLLLLLSCQLITAQDTTGRASALIAAEELNRQHTATNKADNLKNSSEGLLTAFCGNYLNSVTYKFKSFLHQSLDMFKVGDDIYSMTTQPKTIGSVFSASFSHSEPLPKIRISYAVSIVNDHDFIIDKCIITGDFNLIVKLYTQYWNTSLQFNNKKPGEIVYNYYLSDRISLKLDEPNNFAEITIEKTQ